MIQALTIATSDSGAGAGVQADLKTFAALKVYGLSVFVALTAQNTREVKSIYPLPESFINDQIDVLFEDFNIDAIKTGMLYDSNIIEVVSKKLSFYKAKNLVIDPVMISKSGCILLKNEAIESLKNKLLPLSTLITPNILEAEHLTNLSIDNIDAMKLAAKKLMDYGCKAVLVKGGHLNSEEASDVLYDGKNYNIFRAKRINTKNTHGTGCTYSSAIAAGLAKGLSIYKAIEEAKEYLTNAIKAAQSLNVGSGFGPLNHFYFFT